MPLTAPSSHCQVIRHKHYTAAARAAVAAFLPAAAATARCCRQPLVKVALRGQVALARQGFHYGQAPRLLQCGIVQPRLAQHGGVVAGCLGRRQKHDAGGGGGRDCYRGRRGVWPAAQGHLDQLHQQEGSLGAQAVAQQQRAAQVGSLQRLHGGVHRAVIGV